MSEFEKKIEHLQEELYQKRKIIKEDLEKISFN